METEGLKNGNASTSNKPCLKKSRICLYVSGLVISSYSLIVPYFARELQPYCDSTCLSLVLSLFAMFRLLASLITGLYICELGARNSIVNNLVLNVASLILISFVPRIIGREGGSPATNLCTKIGHYFLTLDFHSWFII